MKFEWFKTEIELTGIEIVDFSKSSLSAKLQWGIEVTYIEKYWYHHWIVAKGSHTAKSDELAVALLIILQDVKPELSKISDHLALLLVFERCSQLLLKLAYEEHKEQHHESLPFFEDSKTTPTSDRT